ncbi:MAG: hypothetical protein HY711_06835 [Candidatus Melainabacteria bacterium]|nr:hypothetical protein [Candidatus Melainabacteria bacterium]
MDADSPQTMRHTPAEVRRAETMVDNYKKDLRELLEDKEPKQKSPATRGDLEHVENMGQVAVMSMPPGWQEGQTLANVRGNSIYKEFCSPEDPAVRISFFYRGVPVSHTAADAFHAILEQPAHRLTSEEMKSLAQVLRGKDSTEEFLFSSARTEDLNGKLVLVLEGRYKENQIDMQEILIDADSTGAVVQEIEFQAPKDKFIKYLMKARDSFKSIIWK